ncbi:signal transduction histidine kinase [Bradyrhizobium sp. 83012]|uniref:Signal transduction histidine kinase n=1 Tax=Bradyrhizobium aeschynomenes TaxID=2734909 RepID=A0ABX2CIW4_9BRAD|nr:signal transduction histidine kinase [Bradyrhizobium aeschynomenes]NPU11402.1 signal transduction histidine kinase [Bradyrhizobium aeschynomenes]NPU67197.1 signal transduction histidine kinase [Bradyrhizobium aeschynomenes]NPV22032.1 signal transduction histidine kinase [Bradyrhizobium aeschynomenes]
MPLSHFRIDQSPHTMDGLRLFAQDGNDPVEAFVSRRVLDTWAESVEHRGGHQSLFRNQYNALGQLNLPALTRIVSAKYERGPAFNRQHPFIDVLFSDIAESEEDLNLTELVRDELPPRFHRLT